ncbi:signal peptide peptidase SppA [Gammaproteobacteria bacterium LSUCC0112]|nr:signal peptide peptidase SppA [Gammaproteobacteria bacterium LSUCC0112]
MSAFFSLLGRIIDALGLFIGRLLFVLLLVVVLFLIFAEPDAPQVPSESALVLAPAGVISEEVPIATATDLLLGSGVMGGSLLHDLLVALDRAATDDRIKALVIDTRDLVSISPAQMETLGNALELFKASGKPVYAWGESFNQQQYALASYADSIMLHPMGSVLLNGYGGSQLFFRDLLERLNVTVHIFRVGEFKSASEPYTRMDMSPESRADSQSLVDALWGRYLDRVAANREMPAEVFQMYADQFAQRLLTANGDMARVAFEAGLVDNIAGAESFRRQVAATVGVQDGSFRQIHFEDYLYASAVTELAVTDQVGVIVAQGTIMPGEQAPGIIGADSTVELIRQAQQNDAIRSVVLRIDSPGGSAIASEEIRAALVQLQQSGKPVVVSMGGTAASGGYWIAATADEIWASPATITGSIGVIGMIPTFENALDYLGVGVDGVGTTALSRAGDPLNGLNDTMQMIYQSNVEDAYRRFLQLVADGRNMSVPEVDAIAQGRVWTGEQALGLGLVDSLGDLEQAINAAAQLAGLNEWQSVYLQRPLSPSEQFLIQIMDTMGATQVTATLQNSLGLAASQGQQTQLESLLGVALSALPPTLRWHWSAMLSVLLPSNQGTGQLRLMMVCDTCTGIH